MDSSERGGLVRILLAEDDDDDFFLTCEALKENRLRNEISRVKDGEELMEYLLHKGEFVRSAPPEPSLILLDLNMPRMDGREALRAIRSNPQFSNIPIVVLTTSSSEDDLRAARAAGCNDFVTKPATFSGLVDIAREISERWLGDSDHGVTRSE